MITVPRTQVSLLDAAAIHRPPSGQDVEQGKSKPTAPDTSYHPTSPVMPDSHNLMPRPSHAGMQQMQVMTMNSG